MKNKVYLEETGVPGVYKVHGVEHTKGKLDINVLEKKLSKPLQEGPIQKWEIKRRKL